jgi:hypothetical protein
MEDKYLINNFCIIPDFIWKDKNLNNTEKCLLGRIFALQHNKEGWCFAGNDKLAEEINLSASRTKKIVSKLVSKGYLDRKLIFDTKVLEIEKRLLRVRSGVENSTGGGVENDTGVGLKMTPPRGENDPYRVANRIDNRKERESEKFSDKQMLLNLPDFVIEEMVTKFNCDKKQVIQKGEELYDWSLANGKNKKDWVATLRNAIRKDYGKRLTDRELKQKELEEIRKEYPGLEIVGGGYDGL